jgi:hypothetical protein
MRLMSLEELMSAVDVQEPLNETMTYDQLFRISDPKRFQRSFHVRMPPMELDSYQTKNHWVFSHFFNAKSAPGHSTTGLRHRGHIRFMKPKRSGKGKETPLSQLPVEVDCVCPDYRFRWAFANHQRKASPIGDGSLNKCINKAPRKTNPGCVPGLCKHLLATRDFIYGLLSDFPEDVGPSERLNQITKIATKRYLNYDADMDKAREREALIAKNRARRNIGLPPEAQNATPSHLNALTPPPLPADVLSKLPPVPTAPEVTTKAALPTPPGQRGRTLPASAPASRPTALPPGERGRTMPTAAPALATSPGQRGRTLPTSQSSLATPPGQRGRSLPPATGKKLTPEEAESIPKGKFINRGKLKTEGVDTMKNSTIMKTLTLQEAAGLNKARKLVQEMEEEGLNDMALDSMPAAPGEDGGAGGDTAMEPPVSDSAIGAETEDNVALGLLREIRDLLSQLASSEAAEAEAPPEIPEGGEEGLPGEGEPEDRQDQEDDYKPGKRPLPATTGGE